MMKKALSVLLIILLLFISPIIPITAVCTELAGTCSVLDVTDTGTYEDLVETSANYSTDWRYWSQGASSHGNRSYGMVAFGCWIVAMSKMFMEAKIAPVNFNPDVFYWWERSNGWVPDTDYDLNQKNGAQAPLAYANAQGKTLTKVNVVNNPSSNNLWSYINSGYYTILCVPVVNGSHYVYIDKNTSKSKNVIYVMDSSSGMVSWGSRSLYDNYSGVSKAYIYKGSDNNSISAQDLGTKFYANIVPTGASTSLAMTVNGSNVELGALDYSGAQTWYFERQSDKSYEIKNKATNTCMDVANWGTANGTNIQVVSDSNNDAQRFYFVKNGDGYYILPKFNTASALDITGGNLVAGKNIQVYKKNDTVAQRFSINKLSTPSKTTITTFDLQNWSDGSFRQLDIVWTATTFTDYYQVLIYDWYTGELIKTIDCGKSTSATLYYSDVPKGEYSVYIKSSNIIEYSLSDYYYAYFATAPKPESGWISASDSVVAVGEEITFVFGGENVSSVTNYWLTIKREGTVVVDENANYYKDTGRTLSFDTPGTYTAYVNVYHNSGSVTSPEAYFSVVEPHTEITNFDLQNWSDGSFRQLDIAWVGTPNPNSFEILFYDFETGECVKSIDCGTITFTTLYYSDVPKGKYWVCVKSWYSNSADWSDSQLGEFVAPPVPKSAWINASKEIAAVGDEITFTFGGENVTSVTNYWLTIKRDGTVVVDENANYYKETGRTLTFDILGIYTAYVNVNHNSGSVDSPEITFTVVEHYTDPTTGILGDADGDGEVSILDATIIQRCLANYTVNDPDIVRRCGDADEDGELTILDVTLIQRYLANYTVGHPIGQSITG